MVTVKLAKVRCKHCGHIWIPRVSNVTWCPKCLRGEIEMYEEEELAGKT